MTELIQILKEHARRYPLMQPCDAVKLIYQNEFGGGHLIKDPEQSLLRLRAEFAEVIHDPSAALYEDIGNGVVRVNLAAVDISAYPLERLNHDFVRSSEIHTGTPGSFIKKLGILKEHFTGIGFGFLYAELEEYLAKYERAGYPMVSHSDIYRGAYMPAYRVIVKD